MKALTALGLVLATALAAGCSGNAPAETTASDQQGIAIREGLTTVGVTLDPRTSSATLFLAGGSTTLGVFQGALAYEYECTRGVCAGTLESAGFVLDDFTTTVNFVSASGLSMAALVTVRNPRVDVLGTPTLSYSSTTGWDVPAGTPVAFSGIVSGCFLGANGACSTTIPLTFEVGPGVLPAPLYISAGTSPSIHGAFRFQLSASASFAGIPVTLNGPASVSLLASGS